MAHARACAPCLAWVGGWGWLCLRVRASACAVLLRVGAGRLAGVALWACPPQAALMGAASPCPAPPAPLRRRPGC
eukprot:12142549-Alexandrium_andersonii.AAC.1